MYFFQILGQKAYGNSILNLHMMFLCIIFIVCIILHNFIICLIFIICIIFIVYMIFIICLIFVVCMIFIICLIFIICIIFFVAYGFCLWFICFLLIILLFIYLLYSVFNFYNDLYPFSACTSSLKEAYICLPIHTSFISSLIIFFLRWLHIISYCAFISPAHTLNGSLEPIFLFHFCFRCFFHSFFQIAILF